MRQRRHARSESRDDVRDDGNVDVTSRQGETGTFTPDGEWSSDERSASTEFRRLEAEQVWATVWQTAGRDEETTPRHVRALRDEWVAR